MNALERELMLVRATGWLAAVLLLLALAPLGRLKRTFGLWSLATASIHFGAGVATGLVPYPVLLIYEPHLRAGTAALLVLLFLGATSFPRLVRSLRIRHWKPLHRAVYLAALLVLLHALTSPRAPRWVVLGLASSLALLASIRVSRWRGRSAAAPVPASRGSRASSPPS